MSKLLLLLFLVLSVLNRQSLNVSFAETRGCSRGCECSGDGIMECDGTIVDDEIYILSDWVKYIKFKADSVPCDCRAKQLIDWAQSNGVELTGICSGLSHDHLCDEANHRHRRALEDKESGPPNATVPSVPGLPVWPCDFEQGFCQWYQLSDSDFAWTRMRGSTPSFLTGPSGDHTTGGGWYIYIETSDPQREGHTSRLVSPTLRPVQPGKPCNISFYTHINGRHIGQLNIHQAPVIGHDVIKMSITSELGDKWVKKEVAFDSKREFQIILEGIRGTSYQGDIALDDIAVSAGCQRIEPAYVRLDSGSSFYSGQVAVYYNDSWGRVCREGWTASDSDVMCRELGFVNDTQTQGVAMSVPTAGLVNLTCRGSDKSVSQCTNSSWEEAINCSTNKIASLVCQGIAPICPALNHLRCPRQGNESLGKCISHGQLCDFQNDCWNGWDEMGCHNYTRCTFEDANLCGWIQVKSDQMDWTRHRGTTPTSYTGPTGDHTGDLSKYYIYIEASTGAEKARLAVVPRFQGNHEGLCKVRFFYHMSGRSIGTLRVLVTDWFTTRTVWQKDGAQSRKWRRAEVTLLNTTRSFQVLFEAEHSKRQSTKGDIAIDDVSFTPECKPALLENVTCSADTFQCPTGQCIPLENRCDYNKDCFDGADEKNCGTRTPGQCDFEQGFCDWKNLTNDDFDFERGSSDTRSYGTGPDYDHTLGYGKSGSYIYIEASNPRVQNDKALLASPQFMWKGVTDCKLHFFYHMYARSSYSSSMGTLKVNLKNTITSKTITLWQISGSQGNRWIRASVPIATAWAVSQIVLEAIRGSSFRSDIAIDDISFSPQCYPSEAVHIDKNYDVRLVGAKASYKGRVEVYRVGEWGTVCHDEWNTPDANVVCRQLGYSRAMTVDNSLTFGPGKGQIWLDNLQCYGNESSLNECGHNGWAQHNCDHSKDATVTCDISGGTTKPARLTGASNNTHGGLVEIYHAGAWGLICYDSWNLHDARVVCRQVGFSGVEGITMETASGSPRVHLGTVSCLGNEDSLGECPHSGWGVNTNCRNGFAGVLCRRTGASEGDVRLAGGRSPKEGRVEIFYRGEWGSVCEDSWSMEDAKVVCYELGFTGVVNSYQSFGPGRGHVWLSNVRCTGSETALALCPRRPWGTNWCSHNEDVGVICSDGVYIGCFIDRNPHVMSYKAPTISDLTPVKCIRHCQLKGYAYAGLQWSTECFCGSHYSKYGNTSESECVSPCGGDVTKMCGAPWRLSVYSANPAILPSVSPGYPPVRQSCSYLRTWSSSLATLHPRTSPNYFSGTHTNGYITSPNYPSNYPNKVHCVWVISLLPGTYARIQFVSFNTEQRFDYIEIRDGKRSYSRLLTPSQGVSGRNISTTVYTASSNTMWIKFYSDSSINKMGFKLLYSSVGAISTPTPHPWDHTTISPSRLPSVQKVVGGCNNVNHAAGTTFGYSDYYHNSGYVQSPNYPSNYPNSQVCYWTILVEPGYTIQVTVADMGLIAPDYFSVDDDGSAVSSTGRRVPFYFRSRSHYVQVSFSSDAHGTSRGFRLTYNRVFTTARPTGNHINIRHGVSLHHGLTPAESAGIAFGVLIPIVLLVILLLLFLKYRKKRNNQGARHSFVNEAYDNDGTAVAEPICNGGTTNGPPVMTPTEPSVYYAALAPPPYSDAAPTGGVYFISANGNVANGSQYANLYSNPPPYMPNNDTLNSTTAPAPTANGTTTTTGIGSVTNLKDAASNNVPVAALGAGRQQHASMLPSLYGAASDGLPTVDDGSFVKRLLPSIGVAAGEAKQPIPQDQADPLPEKVPITVKTPAPSQATGDHPPLRVVSPTQSGMSFDIDVPFEFICPITNEIMKRPVSAADGYTYERRAIKSWLRRNPTSPMTNEPITDLALQPNDDLRGRIEEFVSAHSQV